MAVAAVCCHHVDEWWTHAGVIPRVQPVTVRASLKPRSQAALLFSTENLATFFLSSITTAMRWQTWTAPVVWEVLGIIFHTCTFFSAAFLSYSGSVSSDLFKRGKKANPPTYFYSCKCVQVWKTSKAATSSRRWLIPVLLGLGTRTSAMAEMMVLFTVCLLTRSIILSVISLMGLRSKRRSSVDYKCQEEREVRNVKSAWVQVPSCLPLIVFTRCQN